MTSSQKYLYFFKGNIFFNEKDTLRKYIKENNLKLDDISIIKFIGFYKGKDDCIKIIKNKKSIICTPSLIGYYYFDNDKGKWFGTYGSLRDEYEAIKANGIVLTHDIYGTLDILNNNCHGPNDKIFKLNKKIL